MFVLINEKLMAINSIPAAINLKRIWEQWDTRSREQHNNPEANSNLHFVYLKIWNIIMRVLRSSSLDRVDSHSHLTSLMHKWPLDYMRTEWDEEKS
jgi:hypothetical protein